MSFSLIFFENNDIIGSGFPPTSGKTPPTSRSSDWPNRDSHMAYNQPILTPNLALIPQKSVGYMDL